MADAHMSNDEFFGRLAQLFESRREKGHGSIYLTQKRLTFDLTSAASTPTNTPTKVPDDPLWDLNPPSPLPVIIRATNGKGKEARGDKIKLSTIVQPNALEGFYARYAEVCKAGMQALKKRDRSRKKKDKGKSKRKKGPAEGERKG